MNSADFATISELDAAEVRRLAETCVFDWCPCPASKGMECYQGMAPGYNVMVVRANTEKGPTYEGMIVPRTGLMARTAQDLSKYLWDTAQTAVSQAAAMTRFGLTFGDTEMREAPPLMSSPPAWLDAWEKHDIEARRAFVFFLDMLHVLSMPKIVGDSRTLPLWHVPASGNVYAVDKEKKTFTLISGKTDEWHWKNYAVLKKQGYAVMVSPVEMAIGAGKTSITLLQNGEYSSAE